MFSLRNGAGLAGVKGSDMARETTHPGQVLRMEFMLPPGLSARALGSAIGVPGNRISDIARRRRDVSADTAMRLAHYFNTTPRFWLNLQAAHDVSRAEIAFDYSAIAPRAA